MKLGGRPIIWNLTHSAWRRLMRLSRTLHRFRQRHVSLMLWRLLGPSLVSNGDFIFSGSLLETTGPYLGGAFNSTLVNARTVGSAIVNITSVTTGTLSYAVDGVAVTKSIQRQTFRNAAMSGNYVGASVSTVTGCGPTTNFAGASDITISQSGAAATIVAGGTTGVTCTFAGSYRAAGWAQ